MLRQQAPNPAGKPNLSLADFVAPAGAGVRDHVGAFAVTAGIGADALAAGFERALDDYSAIMVKALADRLVEAFAEYLHERARREWGYGADESLSNEELIAEKYRGIRPAFGYPACPNHPEKRTLFSLLDAPAVGIELTESYRDGSGRERERPLLRAPAGALLHRRTHRARPGRVLREARRDDAAPKRSAGSRRTSATTRKSEAICARSNRIHGAFRAATRRLAPSRPA